MTNLAGRSASAAVPSSHLHRGPFLSWLALIAALNGFAGVAIATVGEHGLSYALFELFGISAISWIALAAATALLRADDGEPVRPGDWLAALLVGLVAIVPVAAASAITLTGLSLWMIGTATPGAAIRRAGIICLALTGTLIWGRLILAVFSHPLLDIDAWFVARLFGVEQASNTLAFADGGGGIAVAPGCSSWQGMSLALLFWVTVNQWFRVPLSWRSVGWCLAALVATVAINVVRIGAMVRFPAYLDEIHHGWGWHVSMWSTLLAVVLLTLYGARREAFPR